MKTKHKRNKYLIPSVLLAATLMSPTFAYASEDVTANIPDSISYNANLTVDALVKGYNMASDPGNELTKDSPVSINATCSGSVKPEGMKSHTIASASAKIADEDEEKVDVEIYTAADEEAGVLNVYTKEDDKTWRLTSEEYQSFLDGIAEMSQENSTNIEDTFGEASGQEEINGVNCNKYSKSFSLSELFEMAESANEEVKDETVSEALNEVKSAAEVLGGIKFDIIYFADTETEQPVRIDIDAANSDLSMLNQMCQSLLSSEFELVLNECKVSMDFNYDDVAVEEVEVPGDVIDSAYVNESEDAAPVADDADYTDTASDAEFDENTIVVHSGEEFDPDMTMEEFNEKVESGEIDW